MGNLTDNIYRERGKGIIVTRELDSGMDLCPHEWEEVAKRHEFTIYKCKRSGCLRFDTSSRTALDDFIRFLRSHLKKFPKLGKIPESGYTGLENLRKEMDLTDYGQLKKYVEVVKGFDILDEGSPGIIRISTNGERLALYHDPQEEPNLSGILSIGEVSFGTFLLCDSWKRGDWDWSEVIAGISLLVDGGTRALTDKGIFERLFDLTSENWG